MGRWLVIMALWIATTVQPGHAQPASRDPGLTGKTCRISGRVLDSRTGEPVAGIDVFDFAAPEDGPRKTDSHGEFHFDKIAPGRHGLSSSLAGSYRFESLVVLAEGEVIEGLEIRAVAGATITGKISNSDGVPVEGLLMSALRSARQDARNLLGRGGIPVRTDKRGEYRLSNLPPGRYLIVAERSRTVMKRPADLDKDGEVQDAEPRREEVTTYYPGVALAVQAGEIELGAGQMIEGIDFTLARERTFCVYGSLEKVVPGEARRIELALHADTYFGSAQLARGQMAEGEPFEVCGLNAGSYEFLATPLEGQEGKYGSAPFEIGNRSVRLAPIALRGFLKLAGHLRVDGDREARVLGSTATISVWSNRPLVSGLKLRTGVEQTGAFEIPAVLPESYWLNVRVPDGYFLKGAWQAGIDAKRSRIHALGGDVEVVLGKGGARLTVSVEDRSTKPKPGAMVIIARDPLAPNPSSDELQMSRCDQRGRTTFTSLAPGKYRVLAYINDWLDPSLAYDRFTADGARAVVIQLEDGDTRGVATVPVDAKPR